MATHAERARQREIAERAFGQGLTLDRVFELLPNVPEGTLRKWRTKWGKRTGSAGSVAAPGTLQVPQGDQEGPGAGTEDPLAYWRERMEYLAGAEQAAIAAGKGQLAGNLGNQLLQTRKQYDKVLTETAAQRELEARAELDDPADLAERILGKLELVVRLAPLAQAESVFRRLGRVLEIRRGREG